MNSLTFDDAKRIHRRYDGVFKRQDVGKLSLFSYYYADPKVFASEPMSRNLRGVVFDATNGQIVALPFHKFFNINENDNTKEENLTFDGLMMDKQDGSLAQVAYYNGELIVASRSSLNGYVNEKASQLLDDELLSYIQKFPNETFLFELLDPENRIVLSYPRAELVFLNARDKYTGDYTGTNHRAYIPCRCVPVQRIEPSIWPRVRDALATRTHFEGYVLHLGNEFYKAKTRWYMDSHKIVTEQSPRAFIQYWADNSLDDIVSSLRTLGHDEVINEIDEYIAITKELISMKLYTMLAVAESSETPKELAIALQSKYMNDNIDNMLMRYVMNAYRDNNLDFRETYNAFRTSLTNNSQKVKRLVDEVEKHKA